MAKRILTKGVKAMAQIVDLNREFIARCPCGSTEFNLIATGPGMVSGIIGIKCAECNSAVILSPIKKMDEKQLMKGDNGG